MTSDDLARWPLLARGSTADVVDLPDDQILKLYRPHIADERIDRERLGLSLAAAAQVPVPRLYGTWQVANRKGLLLGRIRGHVLRRALFRPPWQIAVKLSQMAILQATIHRVEATSLGHGRCLAEYSLARAGLPNAVHADLTARLDKTSAMQSLCHGDFHAGNLIQSADRLWVLDWDKCYAGDPAADVARTIVMLKYGKRTAGGPGFFESALRTWLAERYWKSYVQVGDPDVATRIAYWLPVQIAIKLPFVPARQRPRMLRELSHGLRIGASGAG